MFAKNSSRQYDVPGTKLRGAYKYVVNEPSASKASDIESAAHYSTPGSALSHPRIPSTSSHHAYSQSRYNDPTSVRDSSSTLPARPSRETPISIPSSGATNVSSHESARINSHNTYNPMASPLQTPSSSFQHKRSSNQSMSSRISALTGSTSRSSFDRGSGETHQTTDTLASSQMPPSTESLGAKKSSFDSTNNKARQVPIDEIQPSWARGSQRHNSTAPPSAVQSSDHESRNRLLRRMKGAGGVSAGATTRGATSNDAYSNIRPAEESQPVATLVSSQPDVKRSNSANQQPDRDSRNNAVPTHNARVPTEVATSPLPTNNQSRLLKPSVPQNLTAMANHLAPATTGTPSSSSNRHVKRTATSGSVSYDNHPDLIKLKQTTVPLIVPHVASTTTPAYDALQSPTQPANRQVWNSIKGSRPTQTTSNEGYRSDLMQHDQIMASPRAPNVDASIDVKGSNRKSSLLSSPATTFLTAIDSPQTMSSATITPTSVTPNVASMQALASPSPNSATTAQVQALFSPSATRLPTPHPNRASILAKTQSEIGVPATPPPLPPASTRPTISQLPNVERDRAAAQPAVPAIPSHLRSPISPHSPYSGSRSSMYFTDSQSAAPTLYQSPMKEKNSNLPLLARGQDSKSPVPAHNSTSIHNYIPEAPMPMQASVSSPPHNGLGLEHADGQNVRVFSEVIHSVTTKSTIVQSGLSSSVVGVSQPQTLVDRLAHDHATQRTPSQLDAAAHRAPPPQYHDVVQSRSQPPPPPPSKRFSIFRPDNSKSTSSAAQMQQTGQTQQGGLLNMFRPKSPSRATSPPAVVSLHRATSQAGPRLISTPGLAHGRSNSSTSFPPNRLQSPSPMPSVSSRPQTPSSPPPTRTASSKGFLSFFRKSSSQRKALSIASNEAVIEPDGCAMSSASSVHTSEFGAGVPAHGPNGAGGLSRKILKGVVAQGPPTKDRVQDWRMNTEPNKKPGVTWDLPTSGEDDGFQTDVGSSSAVSGYSSTRSRSIYVSEPESSVAR